MDSIISLFRVLSRFGRGKTVLLLILLLLNGLLEGVGIATLLPVLMMVGGEGVGQGASPLAKAIVEAVQYLSLPSELWMLSLISAAALVLREIIAFGIQVYAAYVIADIAAKNRRTLLEAFMKANWSYFQDNQLGGMAILLTQFTNMAASAMGTAINTAALMVRTIIFILLIIFVSGSLALLAFVSALVLFSPLFFLIRLTKKYSTKYTRISENLNAHFADVFTSIKVIKAMGLEDSVVPLFVKFISRLKYFDRRLAIADRSLRAMQNTAAIILVFGLLYIAVVWMNASVVELGVSAGLILSIVKSFTRSQSSLQKLATREPYLWRIEEMGREANANREHIGGKVSPHLQEGIAFKDVSFSYPEKNLFRHINFTIPAGGISVFIGPSGSGKTTLIDLLTGLFQPQEGDILLDGTPIRETDIGKWRSSIGYVPQELILLTGTVRDNVTLGSDADNEAISAALELSGAADFVAALPNGLDTEIGERGLKLSGGQRQRLSLARALVRRPKLLILDEVTSALDPETEKRLVRQVSALSGKMTIIAITHTAAWLSVADKVLQVNNGVIDEQTRKR